MMLTPFAARIIRERIFGNHFTLKFHFHNQIRVAGLNYKRFFVYLFCNLALISKFNHF